MNLSDYLCIVNSITRHIEYLILHHECVTVPGFGAFIAHHSSARIDEETGIIIPPSRTLSFNSDISRNDGLLASSIARATNATFDMAMSSIENQVASLKSQINNSGEFAIGRLGILKNNAEGNPVFEPFKTTSISPRYVGLPSFNIKPFEVATKTDESPQKTMGIRTVFRAAASVAVLLGLGLMLSTPIVEHRSEMATFGKNLIQAKAEPLTIKIENPRQTLFFARPDSTNAIGIFNPAPAKPTAETVKKAITAKTEPTDKYFLIVASLPSKQKAEEYIAANPGEQLNILASDGRYRIYTASGSSYSEVYSALSSGNNAVKYPDAWVFCR